MWLGGGGRGGTELGKTRLCACWLVPELDKNVSAKEVYCSREPKKESTLENRVGSRGAEEEH